MSIEKQINFLKTALSKDDWNSYGAKAVTKEAIARLETMLSYLSIGGSPNGGIEVEWDLGGLCFTISIDPDGKVRS